MSFRTISITLPEEMIEEIDEMLRKKNFASRSDFVRHLIRMWFLGLFGVAGGIVQGQAGYGARAAFADGDDPLGGLDLEFGIPKKVVDLIEEKVKSLN